MKPLLEYPGWVLLERKDLVQEGDVYIYHGGKFPAYEGYRNPENGGYPLNGRSFYNNSLAGHATDGITWSFARKGDGKIKLPGNRNFSKQLPLP